MLVLCASERGGASEEGDPKAFESEKASEEVTEVECSASG